MFDETVENEAVETGAEAYEEAIEDTLGLIHPDPESMLLNQAEGDQSQHCRNLKSRVRPKPVEECTRSLSRR